MVFDERSERKTDGLYYWNQPIYDDMSKYSTESNIASI